MLPELTSASALHLTSVLSWYKPVLSHWIRQKHMTTKLLGLHMPISSSADVKWTIAGRFHLSFRKSSLERPVTKADRICRQSDTGYLCNAEKCHSEQQKFYSCHCEASLLHFAEVNRLIVSLVLPLDPLPLTYFLSLNKLPHSTMSSTKVPILHRSPRICKPKDSSLRPHPCEKVKAGSHLCYVNVVTLEHTYTVHMLHPHKFSLYRLGLVWQQSKLCNNSRKNC